MNEFKDQLDASEKDKVTKLIAELREIAAKGQVGDGTTTADAIREKINETQQASLGLFQKVKIACLSSHIVLTAFSEGLREEERRELVFIRSRGREEGREEGLGSFRFLHLLPLALAFDPSIRSRRLMTYMISVTHFRTSKLYRPAHYPSLRNSACLLYSRIFITPTIYVPHSVVPFLPRHFLLLFTYVTELNLLMVATMSL